VQAGGVERNVVMGPLGCVGETQHPAYKYVLLPLGIIEQPIPLIQHLLTSIGIVPCREFRIHHIYMILNLVLTGHYSKPEGVINFLTYIKSGVTVSIFMDADCPRVAFEGHRWHYCCGFY
jgi:hypothetical protein